MKRKIFTFVIILSFTLSMSSVYAGKVISTYKTPRGNFATEEQETILKNHVGLVVNGVEIKEDIWAHNGTTYVPLRVVSERLGATVKYDDKSWVADISLGSSSNFEIKALTRLNVQLDMIETFANGLKNLDNKFSLGIDEFHLYGSTTELEKTLSEFLLWVDDYNSLYEETNGLLKKNVADSVITTSESQEILSSLNKISQSIDNFEVAIDELFIYLDTRNNNSYRNFHEYRLQAYKYATEASNIVFLQKLYTYDKILK